MDDKHWLRSYPAGVPHEIDTSQYRSLTQLLSRDTHAGHEQAEACLDIQHLARRRLSCNRSGCARRRLRP